MQHPSSDALTWNLEFLGNKLHNLLLVGGIEVFKKAHDCSSMFVRADGGAFLC